MGVQTGTVYETWANENLAATSGSGGGVFTYENADDMINALKTKQIDAALLGKQPALSFEVGASRTWARVRGRHCINSNSLTATLDNRPWVASPHR